MTRIIETIMVEVRCAAWMSTSVHIPPWQCSRESQATIVSTVERGDLVLMPIGWQSEVEQGQVHAYCPTHKKEKVQ